MYMAAKSRAVTTIVWICSISCFGLIMLSYDVSQNQKRSLTYSYHDCNCPLFAMPATSQVQENCSKVVCPDPPPGLAGWLSVDEVLNKKTVTEDDVLLQHPELGPCGRWEPPFCIPRHKVLIIVPFRYRHLQLSKLLGHLIPILQRQMLKFQFIVVEQSGIDLYNKGRLLNAAFTVAEQQNMEFDCVIFHDVDMLPMNDRLSYGCYAQPMHMGAYVDTLNFTKWAYYQAGGVINFRVEHLKLINGFSNLYWGWGGEDNDMGKRILGKNMQIMRPPKDYGRYAMFRHEKRKNVEPTIIESLFQNADERMTHDGLNNVSWTVTNVLKKPLYHYILVNVGKSPAEWNKFP